MRAGIAVLLAAILLASLGGQPTPAVGATLLTVTCPTYGFTVTLPPTWPVAGAACSAHSTVTAADRLASVTVNVYKHPATTEARMQAALRGWLAPLLRRAGPPAFRTVRLGKVPLVTALVTLTPGPHEQTAVYAEAYHSGRLYLISGLATNGAGSPESSAYTQGMLSVVFTLRFTTASVSPPPVTLGRTTLGAPLSRFESDLGAPSTYTASVDLYSWRPCTAVSREVVDVRFSHGVAFRIALLNCSQANLPNYLSIIGTLLPEDATPIGLTTSSKLGLLTLYYSQELHDLLPGALRADPANLHDCGGKPVAAGTLFVGQATGVIAVGLGGCES